METRAVEAVWFALFCLLFVLPILGWLLRQPGESFLGSVRRRRQRHPGHPEDCPLCREETRRLAPDALPVPRQVEPWSARKSKRGRKKSIDTEGVMCPNGDCDYVGNGDSAVHAIVGDGHRGVTDDIPYWRCQCCQRRFSSRLGTPLYQLKTPPSHVTEAMTAFAEGVDVSAAHPRSVFGHDERTLSDWLRKGGQHAQRIQARLLQDLQCGHLQLDELVTRVRSSVHRVWVAIDAATKLVARVHIGRRKKDDAMRFVHGLKSRPAQAGYPIITVPAGFIFGLPIGMGFVGRAYSEPTLIRLASDFEAVTQARRPPQFLPTIEVNAAANGRGPRSQAMSSKALYDSLIRNTRGIRAM